MSDNINVTFEWKSSDRKKHNVQLFCSSNNFENGVDLQYFGKQLYSIDIPLEIHSTYTYKFLIDEHEWKINSKCPIVQSVEHGQLNEINVKPKHISNHSDSFSMGASSFLNLSIPNEENDIYLDVNNNHPNSNRSLTDDEKENLSVSEFNDIMAEIDSDIKHDGKHGHSSDIYFNISQLLMHSKIQWYFNLVSAKNLYSCQPIFIVQENVSDHNFGGKNENNGSSDDDIPFVRKKMKKTVIGMNMNGECNLYNDKLLFNSPMDILLLEDYNNQYSKNSSSSIIQQIIEQYKDQPSILVQTALQALLDGYILKCASASNMNGLKLFFLFECKFCSVIYVI